MKTIARKIMAMVIAASFCFGLASCSKASKGSKLNTVAAGKLTMATNAQFKPYEYHEGALLFCIAVSQPHCRNVGLPSQTKTFGCRQLAIRK